MGYFSRVQIIQRGNKNRQYYLICPSPLAQAFELKKSESIEWIIEDKNTLILRRKTIFKEEGRDHNHGE